MGNEHDAFTGRDPRSGPPEPGTENTDVFFFAGAPAGVVGAGILHFEDREGASAVLDPDAEYRVHVGPVEAFGTDDIGAGRQRVAVVDRPDPAATPGMTPPERVEGSHSDDVTASGQVERGGSFGVGTGRDVGLSAYADAAVIRREDDAVVVAEDVVEAVAAGLGHLDVHAVVPANEDATPPADVTREHVLARVAEHANGAETHLVTAVSDRLDRVGGPAACVSDVTRVPDGQTVKATVTGVGVEVAPVETEHETVVDRVASELDGDRKAPSGGHSR